MAIRAYARSKIRCKHRQPSEHCFRQTDTVRRFVLLRLQIYELFLITKQFVRQNLELMQVIAHDSYKSTRQPSIHWE